MQKLYKYATINNNTLDAISGDHVWYANPEILNDPFDCGLFMSQQERHAFSDRGVFCMTATKSNIIMWSHYADAHRGLCIEYTDHTNEEIGAKRFKSRVNPFDGLRADVLPIIRNAIKVKYVSTEEMNQTISSLPQNWIEGNEQRDADRDKEYEDRATFQTMSTLFLKHEDWKYEQEYRILIGDGGRSVASPGKVSKIFLGMNAPSSHCRIMRRVADSIGAELLKMERVPHKYELVPRELRDSDFAIPHEGESAIRAERPPIRRTQTS